MTTPEERFWAKVRPTGFCWEWIAGTDHGGYGRFRHEQRTAMAHRVAYGFLVGPIEDGLHVDHLCRNRKCVNPDHMDLVTNEENIRRGFGPNHFHSLKTHCPEGHPYDGYNLKMENGKRRCRVCRNKVQRESRRRRTAARLLDAGPYVPPKTLSDAQVDLMLEMSKHGLTQREIAPLFGVGKSTAGVEMLRRRKELAS
jgi:hypothetical protein